MAFLANLLPILEAARAKGRRCFLLAHSMGNWALQAAVETWFAHGNGDAFMFHEAVLAAADEIATSFEFGPAGRLSGLSRLARRTSVYYNRNDKVLDDLSELINGNKRSARMGRAIAPIRHGFLPRPTAWWIAATSPTTSAISRAPTNTIAARPTCAAISSA
jgi:esterase/lipase superfamily enzyme